MKKLGILSAAVVFAFALVQADVSAETVIEEHISTEYQDLRLVKVVDLEYPWAVNWLPDETMIATEKYSGDVLLIRDGEKTKVQGVPESHALPRGGMGGLLDVAVHPDFEEDPWIYLTYSKVTEQRAEGRSRENMSATALARGRLVGDQLEDVEILFVAEPPRPAGMFYGSRLAWLPDGTLLMSSGRRLFGADQQSLTDHAGKMLRFNDDGSIPEDNPFVGRDDAFPEIYSYGNRHVQGLVIHPETHVVWATTHGVLGGDVIYTIEPGGLNYGYPAVHLGRSYGDDQQPVGDRVRPDVVPPVHEFTPRVPPSGLTVVTGDRYPNWKGNFLAGAQATAFIRRMVIEHGTIFHQRCGAGPTMMVSCCGEGACGGEVRIEGWYVAHQEEFLRETIGRIRDVRMGPDDYIYVATDEAEGGVYRLEPIDADG